MILPDQLGQIPHIAVAAGKTGAMSLMNEDDLGGYSRTKHNVLGTYNVGPCWCGQSYFVDASDGLARVVSRGGALGVWKLQASPSPSADQGKVFDCHRAGLGESGFLYVDLLERHDKPDLLGVVSCGECQPSADLSVCFQPGAEREHNDTHLQSHRRQVAECRGSSNLVPVVGCQPQGIRPQQ